MPSTAAWGLPSEFEVAIESLRDAEPRSEVRMREIEAPTKIAPYAYALSAEVMPLADTQDNPVGVGRFVLLYDPSEPEGWRGRFRVVCFAQAPLETEIGVDPFISDVAWSWLVDALDSRHTRYTAASGTATRIMSTGYGEIADQGDGAQIELRASWTPIGANIAPHVESWGDVLCMLVGLPPGDGADNVSLLSLRRNARA